MFLSISDEKEIAKSGLETAQFMIDVALRQYDAKEISYHEMMRKKAVAMDHYMARLDFIDRHRTLSGE